MARKNIEVLEKLDTPVIVTECGSCSAFLKEYPELFEEDPVWKKRAQDIAKKVKAFSEFMVTQIGELNGKSLAGKKLTYHDPCHMSRYQNFTKQPRELIKKIPGINFVEMQEADRCCGAAGSYNIMHYEQSMKVLEKKMEFLKKTGADILTTECPGCVIQLTYGVKKAGLSTKVIHISEADKGSKQVRRRAAGIFGALSPAWSGPWRLASRPFLALDSAGRCRGIDIAVAGACLPVDDTQPAG